MRDTADEFRAMRAAVRDHLHPTEQGARGEHVDELTDTVRDVLAHLDGYTIVRIPDEHDELAAAVTLPADVTLDATWVPIDGWHAGAYFTDDPTGYEFTAHHLLVEFAEHRSRWRRLREWLLNTADVVWWGWR